MLRPLKFIVALGLCVASGVTTASAIDKDSTSPAFDQPPLQFDFAATSPLKTPTGPAESAAGALRGDYASAMTWYRVALASGIQPPLVVPDRIYGDDLAEPLRWTWSTENGNVITRVGRGSFRLSLEDNRSNLFREMDCSLVQWPGGDVQAVMSCDDGTQRTMTIPAEGVVVMDNVQYLRVFPREPLPPAEDLALPEDEAINPE